MTPLSRFQKNFLIVFASRYTKFYIVLVCFLGLSIAATTFFDLDFPWHIRFASDVLKNGIPYLDTYSYTMPSFPYVDHSLLSSVIFSCLYKIGGYGLVSIVIAGVATVGAIIISSNVLWIAPVILSTYFFNFGVRAHVFSFLFAAILFRFTKTFFKTKLNKFLLLPLFMCLWANLHGGFSLGVIYLWGYLIIDHLWLEKAKSNFSEKLQSILAVQLATIATLLTPYGIGTWQEAARTILSSQLKSYIIEWQPIKMLPSFGTILILLLFCVVLYFSRKMKFRKIFTIYLFFQSIFSVRFFPIFALCATSSIATTFDEFIDSYKKKLDQKRLSIGISILTCLTIFIFVIECILQVRYRTVLMYDFYPTDNALAYIQKTQSSGNVFSISNWASYVNWKLPSVKSFVDGRMYVWSQQPHKNELTNAFETYEEIMKGETSYKPVFDQFCINRILWHTENTKSGWYNPKDWDNFVKAIKNDGWVVIYEDSVSTIYQRELPLSCVQN